MANKRCIPTRFFQDPDIIDLCKDTQLILIGLVLNADDEGREVAHPKVLGQAMDYPPEQIEAALQELVAHELLVLYQSGRHRYYSLTQQWQTMGAKMTPSRYPAPPATPPADVPGNSVGNSGKSGVSVGNSAQYKLSQVNSIEGEEEENATGTEVTELTDLLPDNVTPFPQPPHSDDNDGGSVSQDDKEQVTAVTHQVATVLRLPVTEALQRIVTDFLPISTLSVLGEADAAREWIDDPRRNQKKQGMTPAFFRRWLKREHVALQQQQATLAHQKATGTDGPTSSQGTPTQAATPPARPGPAGRSLMDLEDRYRAELAQAGRKK